MWNLTWHRWTGDRDAAGAMLDEHLAWMLEQQRAGRVIASGPTADGEIGIIVFGHMSRDEVDALCATEPFVRAGLREYDVHAWDVHQVLGVGPFDSAAVTAVLRARGDG